jgi:diguanylate cyclase (GGDEF)-like protein
MDLDGLKQVNDSKGHEAGDSLIIGAAKILREAFREQDIAARIGGDEFGVLLPHTAEAAALDLLEQIRECQANYNATSGQLPILFSLGTATAHTIDHFLKIWKEADDCMYIEKAVHKRAENNQ